MNKRDYKNFTRGGIFHVYNRGNNKEPVFRDEQDCRAFLFRLGLALGYDNKELIEHPLTLLPYSRIRIMDSKKGTFKLHAFCLMKNHFHLLIEQCSNVPISKLILKVCTSYARYFNLKYRRVGHLFQDKFKAVLIEDQSQFMWASAYIHMNPVKDGYAAHPSQYQWSSFNDYTSNRRIPFVCKEMLLSVVENDLKYLEKETLDAVSKAAFDI